MRRSACSLAMALAVLTGSGAFAEGENERNPAPAPAPAAAPASAPAAPAQAGRRRVLLRTPEVPGGVIVYDKPVMRNGRLVTWSGAWRQRKGGGAETGRRSAYAETPRREETAPRRRPNLAAAATATAALAAAAAGRAEASASAPEISSPPAPARLTLAGDAWANGATAEINRALGGSGVTLAPAPTGQEGDLSLRYADEWRAGGGAPGLVAIARLYDCEAHLAATGGARFIGDLAGKRIDIGAPGSPGAATARRLLTLLGVAATLNEIPPDEALRRLARGETDATLIIAPRPAAPALPKGAAYVAIPYAPALREAFVPAELPRGDGAPVDTVAVAAVLTAREPDPDSDAHRRLERFAQALHKGLPRLAATAAPMQAKWQDVNFSARTGLPRFAPAQALIDKAAAN